VGALPTDTSMKYLARKTDGRLLQQDEESGLWNFADGESSRSYSREELPNDYFEEVVESDFEMLKERGIKYYKFLSWQSRSDGHGGRKGGTMEEFINKCNEI